MSVVVFMCEFMVVFVVAYAGTVCVSGSVYEKLWGSLFLSDSLVFVRASVCACVCDPLRHLAIHYACREQQTPKCHTSWASLKIKTHTLTVLHSQTNNIRTNPNTHTQVLHILFSDNIQRNTHIRILRKHTGTCINTNSTLLLVNTPCSYLCCFTFCINILSLCY